MYKSDLYSKPHQNLPTWANTDCTNNTNTSAFINTHYDDYSTANKKEVKYAKQKEIIKSLKKQILSTKPTEDVTAIKGVIYDELGSLSNQLTNLDHNHQRIQTENNELKEALRHKEDILLQFQDIIQDSTEKFKRLEQVNDRLRSQLKTQEITNAQIINDHRIDHEKEIEVLNKKIESIENNNKQLQEQIKANLQKENDTQVLYDSFKEIQQEIKNLEETYSKNIEDKGKCLTDLKRELEASNEDKRNLNSTIEDLMKDNETLQYKVNLLEREKEILMQEKTKDHQEIIYLRKNFNWDKGNKNYRESQQLTEEESLSDIFEKRESEYMKEITTLHGVILDRENEIETIKQKLFKQIHDISLEKERLEIRLNERDVMMTSKYKRDTMDSYLYK